MKKNEQVFYGKIVDINEEEKFIKSSILHFDKVNENRWRAMQGSLDAFLERLNRAKKGVAGCYQHDESLLIGVWRDFEVTEKELIGKLYFVDTPFVRDTVLPQVKAGILQGSSPTISPLQDSWNGGMNCWDIIEGVLCEISLVGLPADLRADIIEMRAKIEQKKEGDETDIFLLIN